MSTRIETDEAVLQAMKTAVENAWDLSQLKRYACEWVSYKKGEGFAFSKLTRLHYEMFGGTNVEGMNKICAAVELLMLALDIWDDLQDGDGKEQPWNQIPFAQAMNLATGFFVLSEKMLEESPFEEEKKAAARTILQSQILRAVSGQHVDLTNDIRTEEQYIAMCKRKSGSLTACASLIGIALAGQEKPQEVKEYSENIGVAAQIGNDLRGILRWDRSNDLLQKKYTLPVIYLLNQKEPEARWLQDYYEGRKEQAFLFERKRELAAWIERSAALTCAKVMKRLYQLQAMDTIDRLPVDQVWKERLHRLME